MVKKKKIRIQISSYLKSHLVIAKWDQITEKDGISSKLIH